MKIAFLGAGAFGQALAKVAEENGYTISFFDPYKYPDVALSSTTADADTIIYVAPANVADQILPELPTDVPLICASKGFLSLSPFAKFTNFSALGGAAFAEDIINESPRIGDHIILTGSSELSELIFSSDYITVEHTKDTLGIILCGALKNIYAIGSGLFAQPQEEYLKKVYHELEDILFENGADTNTAKLSCGLPDLLISSTESSRNFQLGQAIKSGSASDIKYLIQEQTVEGYTAIKQLPNYPNFVIPSTASTLKQIIKQVSQY